MSAVVYPGSFDPVTKGHIDVIMRLSAIFDRVVVLVANSTRKSYLFSHEERVALIEHSVKEAAAPARGAGKARRRSKIEVKSSNQLTVNFALEAQIDVIARSVRTVSDWEYEYAMADANRKLAPHIETLFIMADPTFGFISSSLVREVAAFNGNTKPFVPAVVSKALSKKNKNKIRLKRGAK